MALRDTDFGGMYDTADAYDGLDKAFGGHADSWNSGVDQRVRDSGWTGNAGDTAGQSLSLTTSKLRAARVELEMIGEVLRGGADALFLAQSKLRQALFDAQAAGMSVNECGVVSPPPLTGADRHDPDARTSLEAESHGIADRITAAIAEADAADRATADQLRHYTANARNGNGLNLQSATMDRLSTTRTPLDALLNGMPKPDASPAAVNSWWKGLTPDEQQRLIKTHPELIGNCNGIPSLARDQANQIVLPRLVDTYRNKPQPLSPDDQQKLDGFQRIQDRLDGKVDGGEGRPGSNPPLLLLGIGEEGQGRAILCWGNPDTAKNVSSIVPGLNSNLVGAGGGDTASAKRIYDAAQGTELHPDPGSTASMIWLGYDAPQQDVSVATKDRAVVGAASYDQFLAGLRATHEGGAPAHVTSIGHSYGSLVVGQAAQRQGGLPADDIVLVGSPGTGADNASQLGVGQGHVYVGSAMWDPVTHLPSGTNIVLPGTGQLLDPDGLWYGKDPASAGFGAQRFQVDDGAVWDSHDNYFNGKGGESLSNIGKIVAGHPERISREAGR
ncbi:alpha/beta hydrolase [Kitasatospora sp. GP82]|uniref:alpha/beta hydrolase n=1 Tax=Kitasatospora sp. GP82 TaxID=3035089 RepID=UPI0024763709|nr:alpha/beta hydrolase [Kitasatospora sp. GP82]